MSTEPKTSRASRQVASRNGRFQRARITDPDARRAAIKRATSRIKTDARIDFVRSVRGR